MRCSGLIGKYLLGSMKTNSSPEERVKRIPMGEASKSWEGMDSEYIGKQTRARREGKERKGQ